MKCEIPIRIKVLNPIGGVSMQVQRGRDELLPASAITDDQLVFDFFINVDLSSGRPNFLGKFAHGPKDDRFIYVNSGTLAGQPDSCWTRRAKVALMSITADQVNAVLSSPGSCLETSIDGRSRDGGPVCAGVKNAAWEVIGK